MDSTGGEMFLWRRLMRTGLCTFLICIMSGCGSSTTSDQDLNGGGQQSDASDRSQETAVDSDSPFVLGDLIEPFETPTLEELEAAHEWIDNPVVDSLELLRKQKESEPALVSIDEALSMRNDSDEENEKILSALSVLAPRDGTGVDYEATLDRTIQQETRSLNPILASSVAEVQVLSLMGFGLFSFDWNMTPLAAADTVASWRTSEDRMVDLVVMRDDLTWSDGEPITAHDIEFSFKVIMSSKVPVPAQRQGTDQMYMVKAYDDHTLAYFHKEGRATNVWNLNYSVIPKHVYEKSIVDDPTLRRSEYHTSLENKPIVGGSYEVTKRTRGKEIVLSRRESYYMHQGEQVRDKPYYKTIRHRIIEDQNTALLALKSGDIDEGLLGAEQWRTQTNGDDFYRTNTKVRGKEWTFFYICWNLREPMFQDVRVRRALAYAMNYQEMLDDLTFGLYDQSYGIFHPDSWMFPKDPAEPFTFDLDRAEDLLDEAGWDDSDGDGLRDKEINGRIVPFEFSLIVSNKPDRIAICNLFRENLESIGIRCNVAPLEAATLQERCFKKKFQAQMSGWGAGADPFTSENIFGTGKDRNYGSYSNSEVDRLFHEGEFEFDRDKRAQLYGEINNLIYQDQPYLFLYTRSSFYGFNKKLRGYRFSPRGPFSYGPGLGSVWTSVD